MQVPDTQHTQTKTIKTKRKQKHNINTITITRTQTTSTHQTYKQYGYVTNTTMRHHSTINNTKHCNTHNKEPFATSTANTQQQQNTQSNNKQ